MKEGMNVSDRAKFKKLLAAGKTAQEISTTLKVKLAAIELYMPKPVVEEVDEDDVL